MTVPGASPLVACDLDRTLIYSAGASALGSGDHLPELAVAEVHNGEPVSFWTRTAERLLLELGDVATFVPTTTRTTEQFGRVTFPAPPKYAVTANGGHILIDGEACPQWASRVADQLTACASLREVVEHLRRVTDPSWVRTHRAADALFTYLVVERDRMPAEFVAELTVWCEARGWGVSMQGRKVYCVPAPLTKEAAVVEVAARSGASVIFAAGDSLLDAGLLSAAAFGVRPAHGELHDAGWDAGHVAVTAAAGVRAGEEIMTRLLAEVRAASHAADALG